MKEAILPESSYSYYKFFEKRHVNVFTQIHEDCFELNTYFKGCLFSALVYKDRVEAKKIDANNNITEAVFDSPSVFVDFENCPEYLKEHWTLITPKQLRIPVNSFTL